MLKLGKVWSEFVIGKRKMFMDLKYNMGYFQVVTHPSVKPTGLNFGDGMRTSVFPVVLS